MYVDHACIFCILICRLAGKFGEFGESSAIHQTKTIQTSTDIVILITLLLNLFICQTFPRQTFKKSKFAKVSLCQTFHYTV